MSMSFTLNKLLKYIISFELIRWKYYMVYDRKSGKRHRKFKSTMTAPHVLSRGGYDLLEKKLLDEKRKKRQQETMLTENTPLIKDPPSPIERHVKWKMARTKRYRQMTSTAAQEISDKIVSNYLRISQSYLVHQS